MDSNGKVPTENNKKQCILARLTVLCSNEWILSANRKRSFAFFFANTGISPAWNSVKSCSYLVNIYEAFHFLYIIFALFWQMTHEPTLPEQVAVLTQEFFLS